MLHWCQIAVTPDCQLQYDVDCDDHKAEPEKSVVNHSESKQGTEFGVKHQQLLSYGAAAAAKPHLELLVEFAAVPKQHGDVQRTKVCVEAGNTEDTLPEDGQLHTHTHTHRDLDLLFVDELVISAKIVCVGRAFRFTP